MSTREDARDWTIANCLTCGRPFGQEEAWMDSCPVCFKETKGYKLLKGDLAFACLQYEIERLRAVRANPPAEDGDTERFEEEIEHLRSECARLSDDVDKSERKRAKMRLRIKELEGEVERLRANQTVFRRPPVREAPQALDPALLKKLLMLCHPDKHKDDPVATEVTKWILSERQKNNQP